MANSTYLSTVFPDWSQLNFSRDCTAFGQWFSAFVTRQPWNTAVPLGGNIDQSILFMSSALPPGWTFNDSSVSGSGGDVNETIDSPAGTYYFGDVAQWFTQQLYYTYNTTNGFWYSNPLFEAYAIWLPALACQQQFCKAIGLTGNADVSGIGLIISYYIEVSVATLYLVVFSAWRLRRYLRRRKARPPAARRPSTEGPGAVDDAEKVPPETPHRPGRLMRGMHRLFDALRGTFDTFFTAASVLTLAILIAVIVLMTKQTKENRHSPVNQRNIPTGHALYDPALGLLVSLCTVFPVVVLYAAWPQENEVAVTNGSDSDNTNAPASAAPVKRHKGGRTWLRRSVLIVFWVLLVAVVFLDPESELDYEFKGIVPPGDSSNSEYAIVLYACDQRGGRKYWRMLKALQYLIIGVPLLWLLLTGLVYALTSDRFWSKMGKGATAVASTGPGASPGKENVLRQHGRILWRHFVAWLCMAIMWTVLVYLTVFRYNIIVAADGMDKQNEWEFGQILAMAAWGHPAVEFCFLMLFGIEDGIGGRLPIDYAIYHVATFSSASFSSDSASDTDTTASSASSLRSASRSSRCSSRQVAPAPGGSVFDGPPSAKFATRASVSGLHLRHTSSNDSAPAIAHKENQDASSSSSSSSPPQPLHLEQPGANDS